MEQIRMPLVLHFHQPVGNFDEVFRDAFTRCYDPLLKTLEKIPEIPFSLHITGPLLEWLEANEPSYLKRLADLTQAGRVEWLMGGFYEPILPSLPRKDRLGQLNLMRRWIEDHFGTSPQGCWLAERVWEPGLTETLATAGVRYTLLDDQLIRASGFREEQTMQPFLVEDGGETLRILPISEKLRYLIPFGKPEELIEELARTRELGGRLLLYGDDAEKFGLWPGTYDHVFGSGWLQEALQLLVSAQEIVKLCTAGDALADIGYSVPTFIPAGSYREMEEWAAPRTKPSLKEFRQKLKSDPELDQAARIKIWAG